MKNSDKKIRKLFFLSAGLFWGMMILIVPGQALAGQNGHPAGRILFEDKQARVIIIKTPAGVILKITTDDKGKKTVEELEQYPVQSHPGKDR